ncbi:MAG: alpha/beta fold hydrolase [Acidobacteriota bacterium]
MAKDQPKKSPKRRPRTGKSRWSKRPLWTLLGLSALGLTAVVLSSRKIHPMADWQDLLDDEPDPRRLQRFPSAKVPIAGAVGNLAAYDGGAGSPPVIFVHGLGGTAAQWSAQLEALRGAQRAVAVDLRGHGHSEPSEEGAYALADYATDVLAVADQLGLDSFVLVGHSLGALVTIALAAEQPERVAGLFLVDPNGDQSEVPRDEIDQYLRVFERDPAGELHWHFRQILAGADEAVRQQVLQTLEDVEGDAITPSLASASALPAAKLLAKYEGPRKILATDVNQLPISLHQLLPDLPSVHLADTSHWPMLDQPEVVNELLADFLISVRA